MKNSLIFITVLGFVASAIPVSANPNLCYNSAITPSERKAVEILEDMHYVQSEIKITGETLNKLNQQRNQGYDQYSPDSVSKYNNLVNKYNKVVIHSNKLSEQYNQMKNSYNSLLNQISPSENIVFTTCLNSQILNIETNTTSLNVDSLNIRTDNLIIDTGNLRRNTDDLQKNINNLRY
jgi:chemotaxis protein histidine kinase CheA